MSQPYVGEIRLVGFNFAPQGWAFCNGQLMSIAQNDALFALLGTTYGGDGLNTFALPDLQGRIPIHQGAVQGATFVIGEKTGSETVTLNGAQMPAHSHALVASADTAASRSPVGNVPALSTRLIYTSNAPNASTATALSTVGSNQPHDNMQPFLCVNFIISLFGVFPSQN